MITYSFVGTLKYHLRSLGIKTEDPSKINYEYVKMQTLDTLFRLKDISDAFMVNMHYTWISSHWGKIEKALSHRKWGDMESHDKVDVKRARNRYSNIAFSTTMFSKHAETFFLDEKGNIQEDSSTRGKAENDEELVCITDIDGTTYIHSKKYTESLYDPRLADTELALGIIETITLDSDKRKFIVYIILDEENIAKANAAGLTSNARQAVQKQIKAELKEAAMIRTMRLVNTMMVLNSINIVNRMNRMQTNQIRINNRWF